MRGHIAMIDHPDAACDDKGPDANSAQGADKVGPTPQQRHRNRDQSGSEYAQQHQNAFHHIGQLDRHHGVRW